MPKKSNLNIEKIFFSVFFSQASANSEPGSNERQRVRPRRQLNLRNSTEDSVIVLGNCDIYYVARYLWLIIISFFFPLLLRFCSLNKVIINHHEFFFST